MKTRKSILLLIITAFMISAAPVMTTPSWAKSKSTVIGSPYDHQKKYSYDHGSVYHHKLSRSQKSSDNILKKSGRGIKKGAVKVKDGFVWTGEKIKNIFTKD